MSKKISYFESKRLRVEGFLELSELYNVEKIIIVTSNLIYIGTPHFPTDAIECINYLDNNKENPDPKMLPRDMTSSLIFSRLIADKTDVKLDENSYPIFLDNVECYRDLGSTPMFKTNKITIFTDQIVSIHHIFE